VTFDLDLDLEHNLDAFSPGDHRVQVWSRSSHLSGKRNDLKASVEEEVNVPRSEIEKNAFEVFKLKQFVSCLILTLSSPEKDR